MVKSLLLPPNTKTLALKDVLDLEMEKAKNYVDRSFEPSDFLFSAENDNYYLLHKPTKKTCLLTPTAIKHIVEKFGYPRKLIETLDNDLVVKSINQLIEKSPLRHKKHLFRFENKDGIHILRAILSENYCKFDNLQLIATVIDVIKTYNDWEVQKYESNNGETFNLRITKKLTNTLKVGDVTKFGLSFTNSEVGLTCVSAQILLFICRCTNGLMSMQPQDSFNIKHFGNNSKKPDDYLRELLLNSNNSWNELFNNYNNSNLIEIPQPLDFIEKVGQYFELPKKAIDYVGENFRATTKSFVFDDIGSLRDISDSFTETSWVKYSMHDNEYKQLEYAGSSILNDYKRFLPSISSNN